MGRDASGVLAGVFRISLRHSVRALAAGSSEPGGSRAFRPVPGGLDRVLVAGGGRPIDGKTARRTHDRGKGRLALHTLSAYASNARLVLAQLSGPEKASEITAIPEAGEVHLPVVREDHPAAGAVPRHCASPGRSEPVGDDPLRQVRPASALEPSERRLCPRGDRSRCLDPGRLGGGRQRHLGASGRVDPAPRVGGRSAPWRRHDGTRAGEDADRDRSALDLRARRPAIWWHGPAGDMPLRALALGLAGDFRLLGGDGLHDPEGSTAMGREFRRTEVRGSINSRHGLV